MSNEASDTPIIPATGKIDLQKPKSDVIRQFFESIMLCDIYRLPTPTEWAINGGIEEGGGPPAIPESGEQIRGKPSNITYIEGIDDTWRLYLASENEPDCIARPQGERSNKAWSRLSIGVSGTEQATIGITKPFIRTTGIATYQVFVQTTTGTRTLSLLCDQIVWYILSWQLLPLENESFYGLQFAVPTIALGTGSDDGWYQANVSCPFTYDRQL